MNTIRINLANLTQVTQTNKRRAKCPCCKNVYEKGRMHGYKATNRSDDKFQYICDWCIENDRYHSERSRQAEVVGKVENGIKDGIECEMSEMNDFARNWFYSKNWKATNDCSLNGENTCEMVSHTNKGFKAFTKQLPIIEKMLENGDIEMNNSCGTHFHVSMNDMIDENGINVMDKLRRNRKNVFGEMEKLMKENPQKTKEFFGRYFQHYADTLDNTDAYSKYAWVNLVANNNIEFRLNKFTSAKQYHKLCMFEIEVTKYIVANINNPKIKFSKMAKVLANKLERAWG